MDRNHPGEDGPMNTKVFLIIFLSAFGLVILSAIIGNILEAKGALTKEAIGPRGVLVGKAWFFGLFCVLAFSMVPLALRWFLVQQGKIGNAEVGMVRFLQAHEQAVVYGIWGVFVVGLCLAVPAAIKDGFFE
jgi:hypothetical protein